MDFSRTTGCKMCIFVNVALGVQSVYNNCDIAFLTCHNTLSLWLQQTENTL